MKHALALVLVLAGCLDTAPAPDDDLELAAGAQALNGDTWTTVDNNGYANGLGATYNAIAVSQTTSRAFVAGARTENTGSTLWVVRASQPDGNSFLQNDTFTLGGRSRATAATADAAGNVFVAGEAFDATGVPHWVIRKTADNGTTWNTVEDRAYAGQSHAVPSSMSVDGWDLVGIFVTGAITSTTGAVSELTQRAPSGTAAFADYSTIAGRAPTALCTTWNGTALAATLGATTNWDVSATTHGNPTWDATSQTFFAFTPGSCSLSPTNGATLFGGTDGAHWEMGQVKTDGTPIPGGVDPILGDPGTGIHAQLAIFGRAMAAGAIAPSGGGVLKWRTRFTMDNALVVWKDSDSWALASGAPSVAKAMAHDGGNLNGSVIWVAGEATDASGRKHGIVRRLNL